MTGCLREIARVHCKPWAGLLMPIGVVFAVMPLDCNGRRKQFYRDTYDNANDPDESGSGEAAKSGSVRLICLHTGSTSSTLGLVWTHLA